MNASAHYSSRPTLLRGLIVALVLLIPFVVYFGTAQSIVSIWTRSETFAHGYIILPISLWLVWRRRRTLVRMNLTPFWPALVLLAACGFAWLLAELGDVQIVKQYAFAAMLPLAALAILGTAVAREIAFALLFVLFAVPFGEIFINPLIGVTANFTVDALRATGIPVLREGNSFTIPTGSWSVVEACSGVRYLISSFTLGCLYAYLTYRSRWRQALFVLLSILVPIVANGARAYMIVMMGHLSGMTMAVGVDHLIYGWVFFGLVMFLLFWIGSFWREDHRPAPSDIALEQRLRTQPPASSTARLIAAALAVTVCVGIWPAYARYLDRSEPDSATLSLAAVKSNWQDGASFTDWAPGFGTPRASGQQFFEKDGQRVGLTRLYYRNQGPGTQLISSMNRLATAKSNWRSVAEAVRTEDVAGRKLRLREETLAGPQGSLLVWHWYWIGGQTTSNDYVGKALQVQQKFFLGSDDGAAVMLYAPFDDNPERARAALRAFLAANARSLDASLASNQKP